MLAPIEIDPRTFLRQHCTLPALPEIVLQIQNLIQDDKTNLARVAELIASEPALLAQVLKIVNSAYYGLAKQMAEVQIAVTFLGLNEVYRIVLSLSVINTLDIHKKDELNEFWYHSYYTALCTKYMARKYEPHVSFEELWSAAMLHDIGKLVYLKFFSDHYRALSNFCKEQSCLFSEAERHFSLPSSASLGALLCEHWRLPDTIKLACESHGLRDLLAIEASSSTAGFQRMICLGNLLTVLATDNLNNRVRQQIAGVAKKAIHCREEDFLAMMGDIYELRMEVERFMGQFG